MRLRILTVIGTRPEAIKMAPVLVALEKASAVRSALCVTAQHREMLDQVLDLFEIAPSYDLDLMTEGQDLFDVTAGALLGLRKVIKDFEPDLVLVQGDTTTCFTGALAAFYLDVPVGHVEAGLRTGNLAAPFPEEANRSLVSRISRYHFAPTERARQNLLEEGIPDDRIWVTGNTVIDALLSVVDRLGDYDDDFLARRVGPETYGALAGSDGKLILITGHRRENFGQGFRDLCTAIRTLALAHTDWAFVYPVHLNPNVQDPVQEILGGLDNVRLLAPIDYLGFVWLMNRSDLILTDSGGIQEEASSLGKPVLVMREVTERPEAVEAGTVRLVGTNTEKIVANVEMIMSDNAVYGAMSEAHNPYGDGQAARRVVRVLCEIGPPLARVAS